MASRLQKSHDRIGRNKMKIKIITPCVVGIVSTSYSGGGYFVSVSLRKPKANKRIYDLECDVAKQIAVEAANHLKTIGHADPLMHDIPKLVYSYMEKIK